MTDRPRSNGKVNTVAVDVPSVSVIIPAYNEASYLAETIHRLRAAEDHLHANANGVVEILVVDNASTDRTAELAGGLGATVVHEPKRNIARVRNAGAAFAAHNVLVFLDADTLVPPELLLKIARAMNDPTCGGGSVDLLHLPNGQVLRAYFKLWRVVGLALGTGQGACQFCRKSLYQQLGGYDEAWYMGEDLDFYWRLKRLARRRGMRTTFIRDLQVVPSPRRWQAWPVWRTLVWTNPLVGFALRRNKAAWRAWYRDPPR
jgi:glycosyltransferase involved in cell wall biosynthesis